MIGVETALALVLDRAQPLPCERRAVTESLGLVLAEEIVSDIDSPPHDKTLVDGYAVLHADFQAGQADLRLLEEVAAGAVPQETIFPGTTSRVFTGAPIPDGADCMVMVERSEAVIVPGRPTRIHLHDPQIRVGQHIMRRGESLRKDERVLRPGHAIRAIEIGLLSEVGLAEIAVHRRPRVAVLATGNELVPVTSQPGPGKIRNSNGPMLCGLVREAGGEPIDLDVALDDEISLRKKIGQGLECDLLVLSGGVSAGAFDLVPKVLADCGVEQIFHKVNLKPGKPVWFGSIANGESEKLVFGLPGNPVSSLVCFELFVRPALKRMLGRVDWTMAVGHGQLKNPFRQRGDRPTYFPAVAHPAVFQETPHGTAMRVDLLDWHGSADLKTLTTANCLAYFPAGDRQFSAGDEITFYWLT